MISHLCLIIPPSLFLLDERVFMSLGILKVAAVLEREGIGVELLDLSGVKNYTEALTLHIEQSPTRCFGLTATTPQMPAATKIQETIRRLRPSARIILLGPHVTLVCAAAKYERKRSILDAHRERPSNWPKCSTSSSPETAKQRCSRHSKMHAADRRRRRSEVSTISQQCLARGFAIPRPPPNRCIHLSIQHRRHESPIHDCATRLSFRLWILWGEDESFSSPGPHSFF